MQTSDQRQHVLYYAPSLVDEEVGSPAITSMKFGMTPALVE